MRGVDGGLALRVRFDTQEAYELMKEVEPTSPQEYILKGVTNLAIGQQMDSREHLKVAQQRLCPRTLVGARRDRNLGVCPTIARGELVQRCLDSTPAQAPARTKRDVALPMRTPKVTELCPQGVRTL